MQILWRIVCRTMAETAYFYIHVVWNLTTTIENLNASCCTQWDWRKLDNLNFSKYLLILLYQMVLPTFCVVNIQFYQDALVSFVDKKVERRPCPDSLRGSFSPGRRFESILSQRYCFCFTWTGLGNIVQSAQLPCPCLQESWLALLAPSCYIPGKVKN